MHGFSAHILPHPLHPASLLPSCVPPWITQGQVCWQLHRIIFHSFVVPAAGKEDDIFCCIAALSFVEVRSLACRQM